MADSPSSERELSRSEKHESSDTPHVSPEYLTNGWQRQDVRHDMQLLMEAYAGLKRACQSKFEENIQLIEYTDKEDEETGETCHAECLRLQTGRGRPFSISRTSPEQNDFFIYFNDDDTGGLQVDYSFGQDGTVHKRVIDYELPTDEEGNARVISESNGGFTQSKRLARLITDAEVCGSPHRE